MSFFSTPHLVCSSVPTLFLYTDPLIEMWAKHETIDTDRVKNTALFSEPLVPSNMILCCSPEGAETHKNKAERDFQTTVDCLEGPVTLGLQGWIVTSVFLLFLRYCSLNRPTLTTSLIFQGCKHQKKNHALQLHYGMHSSFVTSATHRPDCSSSTTSFFNKSFLHSLLFVFSFVVFTRKSIDNNTDKYRIEKQYW